MPNSNHTTQRPGGFWDQLDWGFTALMKTVAIITGFIILAIVILSLKELIMRNLGRPGSWTGEVIELMVMWCFLLPMAYSQLDGAMIRVTVLTEKFPAKVQVYFLILSSVSAIVFGLFLSIAGYNFFSQTLAGSYFPETGFPTVIQRAGVPACSLMLTFSGLVCMIRAVKGLKNPEKFIAGFEGGE